MTIVDAINERHSVRSYLSRPIEPEKRAVLDKMAAEINAESGLNIQIIYDEPTCFGGGKAHYGKFSGVENYISIVGKKGSSLDEKAGYYGEKLVLFAQMLGLNTCWVALTHGKSKAVIGKGEKEAIIISLGYGASQGQQHNSKAETDVSSVKEDSPDWFKAGVKAALSAPTAINQQKFRIEQAGEKAKITAPFGICTKIDLGIVKYHFEAASGHETI